MHSYYFPMNVKHEELTFHVNIYMIIESEFDDIMILLMRVKKMMLLGVISHLLIL